jgi:CubicO group peptidase (beta-lactamase class C family)
MRAGRLAVAALAVALGIAVFVPPPEAGAQAELAGLEAVALEEMRQRQAPGAAIAVVDGDRVYTRAFGVASVETGEPMRPEMLFRLGSTTKMFTAAAVVLLAEQGKLDLHEPIGRHIPGLAPKLAALTAHRLLSHTAGILDEAPMFGSQDDDALKKEALSWTDARFFAEPGQIYSYSNPGYWLAGLLAEQAGGKPFADQVAASIFAPLGMTRSTFRPTMAMTYPLAQGHDVADGKPLIIRPAANNSASWPAGSIFTSASDLSRWVTAFVNGGRVNGEQVLPASVFSTLATPHAAIPGSSHRYGYGVQVGEWRGLQVVEHGGSRSGYGSIVRMIPSRRFGVAVLANRTGVSLTRTANAAIESALKLAPAPVAPRRPPIATTAAERGRIAGTYSQGTRRVTVEAKGDALLLGQGARETPLQKVGELEFTAGATRYVFVADASGNVTFVHSGGRSWRKVN